jgi:phosphate-selective porin OprO/OprP
MSKASIALGTIVLTVMVTAPAVAGVVVFADGHEKIEIGGRLQLQYRALDTDDSEMTDELFFRNLRPYIAGSLTEDWLGKIQIDFGEAEDSNELSIKDAYMKYSGLDNHTITVGNSNTPFARELLTSSKKQQLIDRTFTGGHNFGTPDRQLGLRLDGHSESRKLSWAAAVGSENHDPAIGQMDFDSPVNRSGDWNQGWVVAGRLDFAPRGSLKFEQGDFNTDGWNYGFGLAAFNWSNDDDNNTFTDPGGAVSAEGLADGKVDLDSAFGGEVSAGLRGHGASIDVDYQIIQGETVDPIFTGGLYRDGETELAKMAIEGGFMLRSAPLELVLGWESLDADNYAEAWRRMSFGINWFINKHNLKWQNTFRRSDNFAGVDGADLNEYVSQFQFLF